MRSNVRGIGMQRNFNAPDGAAAQAAEALGPMPEWNLADLYPSPDGARDRPRPASRGRRSAAHQGGLSGQARASWPRTAPCSPLAIEDYERFVDLMGRLGSYAGLVLRRQPGRPGARQVLRRHLREADRHLDRSHLLRAGAEPDRRCGAGRGAADAGARALQAVARRPAQGEALPARREARAAVPREGPDRRAAPSTGCSTRRCRRCASTSPASPSRWRSSRR